MKHLFSIGLVLCFALSSCITNDEVPKSDYGVIYSNKNCSQKELLQFAETAAKLYSDKKIDGLVIAVKDDDGVLSDLLNKAEYAGHVVLNIEPKGRRKTVRIISDVLGYQKTYMIIGKRNTLKTY